MRVGNGAAGTDNSTKPGYSIVNKYGENLDIDGGDTPVEIWSHGADGTNFPFLDAGIEADLVSTSASDTLAGVGAQKVRVTYYLTDNTEVIEVFDLNGVARVPVSEDMKFCSRIEVIQTGSSNANVGEINLVDRTTGLVVYQSIEVGLSQTLSALQICPKDKVAEVRRVKVSYAKDQNPLGSADMRFNVRKVDGTIITKHPTVISAIKPEDKEEPKVGNVAELVAGEIAFWECVAVSADNTPVEARFDLEVFNA